VAGPFSYPGGFPLNRIRTRCYPILDTGVVLRNITAADRRRRLRSIALELALAEVEILQYRNKRDPDSVVLEDARALREAIREATAATPEAAPPMRLILNDRVSIFDPSLWDGVHVGQEDLAPGAARDAIGPSAILGVSTHNDAQVIAADKEPVDYIAIGPVFSTATKPDTSPVIGLEGVRSARALTHKLLVAIGGITLANAAQVCEAGADSLAVIAAIFAVPDPAKSARDFLAVFK